VGGKKKRRGGKRRGKERFGEQFFYYWLRRRGLGSEYIGEEGQKKGGEKKRIVPTSTPSGNEGEQTGEIQERGGGEEGAFVLSFFFSYRCRLQGIAVAGGGANWQSNQLVPYVIEVDKGGGAGGVSAGAC